MTKINKIPYILLLACTLCAFGCKSNSDSSDDDEPPVTVQPGDNVVFSNQTEFAVKIYSDSMQSVLLMDVAAKESVSCHIDGVPTGNVFYFSYFMDVNGVSVPYGTDDYTVLLNDDSAMTVKITDPKVVNTNKRIILLKNEAASAIVLYSGNIEKFPEGKTASLVNGGDYGIYMLGARDDIATFTVVDGANRVPLSTAADFENGYIYTVVYDGAKIYMRSKGFLDRNMSKKIWKISLSQELGKTLLAGVFKTRENSNDGYMLFARQVYAAVDDENVMNNGAIPYYAFISLEGGLDVEQSFSFADNPKSARFRDVVEYGDYILAAGIKDTADGGRTAFVSSVKGCNIYRELYSLPDSYIASHAVKIIHKKDNVFCVGLDAEEEETERMRPVLVEITIDGYTSATTKVLWESDVKRNLTTNDLVYDEATDTYIVLGAEYKADKWSNSYINFIDGTSGEQKQKELVFNEYSFLKCSKVGDRFAVCGSFINQITLNDEACFQFIDIASDSLDSVPVKFPCENQFLFNRFNSFLYEDDAFILVGFTDCDDEGGGYYPYLVKYDLKSKSIVFEQKYTDLNGYEIYSCYPSDTGFMFELYNEKTLHSFLISPGLLGEFPETTLLTLPKNPSKTISVVDVPLYLYDSYESEAIAVELDFKYGSKVSLDEINAKYEVDDGYSIAGWCNWNTDTEDEEVIFPLTVDKTLYLYPKVMRDVSVFVYDSYKDVNEDDYITERTFKYGASVVFSDLQDCYTPADGYTIIGWYDWDSRNGETAVSFPIKITDTVRLYPKIKISPPTGIYGYALSDSEIYVQWDAHIFAQGYYLYWRDSYGNGDSTPVSNTTQYTISGLSPSISYTISVIAYDSDNEEWSDHSAEYTVQTYEAVVENNWSSVPSGAEIMEPDTGNKYVYLSRNAVHYYYAYFEAGKTYCVWWADRDNADKISDLVGYDPIADVVVYTYYAGGSKGEKHDTSCLISFNCTKSGYYVMEVQGISASEEGNYIITCYENSSML
ncbi:MAG: fibronectin type III domain-containing protein [Treponema sp.]|nr:fibronectin type III domain-containing protein [Treponema sp.]